MLTKPKKDASNSQRKKPKQGTGAKELHVKDDQVPAAPTVNAKMSLPAVEVAPVEKSQGRNPYFQTIFMSVPSGFELGEDWRFKQRVFRFKEKPDESVINALKENGFTYRPSEKAWTIPADYASRTISDKLARHFADGAIRER